MHGIGRQDAVHLPTGERLFFRISDPAQTNTCVTRAQHVERRMAPSLKSTRAGHSRCAHFSLAFDLASHSGMV
jgi:hypothetical protein